MKKWKVVITGKVRPIVFEQLEPLFDIKAWKGASPMPRSELLEWVRDADAIFSTMDAKIDGEVLDHGPNVRVVSQATVGYDNIAVDELTARGIPLGNTRGVLVEATADLTWTLLLASARRICEGVQFVKNGDWERGVGIPFGIDLYGKTLGIVGMGDIGAAVSRRAQASGMKVIYYNRTRRHDEKQLNVAYAPFDDLLMHSDAIIVLVPLTKETKGLFGKREFSIMKKSCYFVNASRGPVVKTDELAEALQREEIAFAALDVTDPEPLPGNHPLLEQKNVLITPHMGSATYETRDRMAMLAVENLINGLHGKALPSCVNESVNKKLN